MKKIMEKPEVKVMKLEAMDVITTSGVKQDGVTIQQLTTSDDNNSICF